MRRNVTVILCLALAAWGASFRPARAQATRAAAGRAPRSDTQTRRAAAQPAQPIDPTGQRMQQLLATWAEHSDQLTSLDVTIRRIDRSPAWGDEEYIGRAMFKTPNKAFLDFNKVNPKTKTPTPHERIVCTGSEVWQYRNDTKQIFVYKLGKQAQQRALQEGPLPFLFNFRADEARQRYMMKLVQEDPKSFTIDIVPLLKIDKECFNAARIILDASNFLPRQIVLVDPNGKGHKYFIISNIAPNKTVMDVNFVGQTIPKWTVHVNEDDGAAEAAPKAAVRPGPDGSPRIVPRSQPQTRRRLFNN